MTKPLRSLHPLPGPLSPPLFTEMFNGALLRDARYNCLDFFRERIDARCPQLESTFDLESDLNISTDQERRCVHVPQQHTIP